MNIGFISTWLHRGAAYVTINYMKMLSGNHLYVFARGGEYFDESLQFPGAKIHKAKRLRGVRIAPKELERWIKRNHIDVVIANEQEEVSAICKVKLNNPQMIFGAYVDYYTEATVDNYGAYDFLICNTMRHYGVFSWHPQCFYLPWCVDTQLYKPTSQRHEELTFFHSMGMSERKGTDILVKVFMENTLGKHAKLVIHTQKDISKMISVEQAAKNNITIIQKSVPAPGLYYLGDVYVYPTTLDGLGLTMYEALSAGLPVIATNDAPMNEIINNENGILVDVQKHTSRSDGYYWPLAYVSEKSLLNAMQTYITDPDLLKKQRVAARKFAEEQLSIEKCRQNLQEIISKIHTVDNAEFCVEYLHKEKKARRAKKTRDLIDILIPVCVETRIRAWIERKRRNKK